MTSSFHTNTCRPLYRDSNWFFVSSRLLHAYAFSRVCRKIEFWFDAVFCIGMSLFELSLALSRYKYMHCRPYYHIGDRSYIQLAFVGNCLKTRMQCNVSICELHHELYANLFINKFFEIRNKIAQSDIYVTHL